MIFLLVLSAFSLVMLALVAYRQLLLLSGEQQIFHEVAVELQQRAHQLLVEKDRIEASVGTDTTQANEQWKNDLAQYMEDYEQEALARRRAFLGR